ncbi:hypothetical protein BN1708_012498, partial [Verticillium longisporum]
SQAELQRDRMGLPVPPPQLAQDQIINQGNIWMLASENPDPARIMLPKHLFSPPWAPGNAQSEKRVASPLRTCSRIRQQRRLKQQPTFHPSFGTVCPRSNWPAEPWKTSIVTRSAQSPVEASSALEEIRTAKEYNGWLVSAGYSRKLRSASYYAPETPLLTSMGPRKRTERKASALSSKNLLQDSPAKTT